MQRKSVGKGGAAHGEARVQGEPSCGSSSKGATVFSSDPTVRGLGMEATDGEDKLGNKGQGAGKVVKGCGFGLGPEFLKVGLFLGREVIRLLVR